METAGRPEFGVCAAVDVRYLRTGGTGGCRPGRRSRFRALLAERAVLAPRVPPHRSGEFCQRELPRCARSWTS